jgi:hypothetical protein
MLIRLYKSIRDRICYKLLIALTSEMYWVQKAMGLPPVTSAVFVYVVILVKCGRFGEISEMFLLTLRG